MVIIIYQLCNGVGEIFIFFFSTENTSDLPTDIDQSVRSSNYIFNYLSKRKNAIKEGRGGDLYEETPILFDKSLFKLIYSLHESN